MQSAKLISALVALTLGAGGNVAFAQAERNQELLDQAQRQAQQQRPGQRPVVRPPGEVQPVQRPQNRVDQRQDHRGDRDHRDDRGGRDYRGERDDRGGRDYRGGRDDRGHRGDYTRGAGPDHSFYRGGRLPREYRSRQYIVSDWRGHHLNAPPRGYQWVQTGGDYVLVAIATGIIASILLNQ